MSYQPDQDHILQLCKEYAEGTKRTIFFVGAGASMEVGMPSWSGLRSELLKRISKAIDDLGQVQGDLEKFRELEELAEDNSRFWEFFDLAAATWNSTYNDFMVDRFDNIIASTPTPAIYKRIWRMRRSRQVFTLNVDTLVTRAFYETHPNRSNYQLLEFDGYSVSDSLSFLSRDKYCVINLHGTYPQKSRWIMDATQRAQLLGGAFGEKYKLYVTRLFQEYNIVFVGLNPSDIAISPFLSRANRAGVLGRHYWICPDPTIEVVRWAQKHNVRLISYHPEKDEHGTPAHTQDICSILDQIEAFRSLDHRISLPSRATPVDPTALQNPIGEVGILQGDRSEGIRRLGGAIAWIGEASGHSSRNLSDFLHEYSIPLQIASMISADTEGFNSVDGYRVKECLQSGGSSSVWLVNRDEDACGQYCAMKALSPDSLASIPIRQSFRRGIESLYLLSASNTRVAPQYIGHSELPLSVVMEFINGATLSDFLLSFSKLQPQFLLNLFRRICESVRACHTCDGQVLHRDIKPGNIMLEGWHPGYQLEDIEGTPIRFINFDLSWHRFTSGDTKSISAEDIGYYAPEQRNSVNSLPPRSAETDIYMLGMVFYYLCSRNAPPDGGSGLSDWAKLVQKAMRSQFTDDLLRARATRLVLEMTQQDMADRVDLSSVIAETEGMISWISGNLASADDDFVVEALAVNAGRPYQWDRSALVATVSANESTDMRIYYKQRGQKALVEFYRQKSGADQRGTFGQRMSEKILNAATILRDAGWDIVSRSSRGLNAEIRVSALRAQANIGKDPWKAASNLLLASFE